MVSLKFPALSKHAANIDITSPTPHPTLVNHHLHLVLRTQPHMPIGEIHLRMKMKMRMMMMMALMMTCFWPCNLLNFCHSYPKSMMSNPQTMVSQTSIATGELPTTIQLAPMLNAHLAHKVKSIGLPSTHVPIHHHSDLQPRHSSLDLASTAHMNSCLHSKQLILGTPLTSTQIQPSSPLATLLLGNPTSSMNYNNLTCSQNLWILTQTPTFGVALLSSTTSFAPKTRMTSTPRSRSFGPMGKIHGSDLMLYRSKTLIP